MSLSCYNIVKRHSRKSNKDKNEQKLSCLNIVKRKKDNKRPPVCTIYTDVSSVGDRSGSMSSTNGGSQEGAVEYMKKQHENAKSNKPILGYHVEFISFDSVPEVHFNGSALQINASVLGKVYNAMKPRGRTRLFDTAIGAVRRQMKRIDSVKSALSREVLSLVKDCPWLIAATTAVMTDGMDNESKYGSMVTCNNIFKKFRKEYGGIAFFIAANQDAAYKASEYGFDPKFSLQMGNDRMSAINAASATAVAQCRSVSSGSSINVPSFTPMEREQSVSQKVYIDNSVVPPPPTLKPSNSIRRNLFP